MDFVVSKEECEKNIKGVCEGCGGPLTAIETVDNSDRPTFWQGCERCSCFRSGVDPKHQKVARRLVVERVIIPFRDMNYLEYKKDPQRLEFYIVTQTAGLSRDIKYIESLLGEIE